MAVQAAADDAYDATGLVDLTLGSGRRLQLVSAARHLSGGSWLVPGLAVRSQPGAAPVTAVGGLAHRVASGPRVLGQAAVAFETSLADGELSGSRYRWEGSATAVGVVVAETLLGWSGHRTLLVPYLRDLGSGTTTSVAFTDAGVRFTLGEEWVEVVVDGKVERRVDLPYGYESRRGLCGLVRLDLAEPGERLGWTVVSSR